MEGVYGNLWHYPLSPTTIEALGRVHIISRKDEVDCSCHTPKTIRVYCRAGTEMLGSVRNKSITEVVKSFSRGTPLSEWRGPVVAFGCYGDPVGHIFRDLDMEDFREMAEFLVDGRDRGSRGGPIHPAFTQAVEGSSLCDASSEATSDNDARNEQGAHH